MASHEPEIPLPKQWSKHVKLAILHVISLAQMALTAARARTVSKRRNGSPGRTVRGKEKDLAP